MFLKIERIYLVIQKYFPFLPNSPASKIGLSDAINKKRSEEAKNLIEDEDIKKTFVSPENYILSGDHGST